MLAARSLSARRAWIEINMWCNAAKHWVSRSARRAWIEIARVILQKKENPRSLSARRAWIEIPWLWTVASISSVALRKESVDRNCCYSARCVGLLSSLSARRAWIEILLCGLSVHIAYVALRKESVDRNNDRHVHGPVVPVALRKESVDRNLT